MWYNDPDIIGVEDWLRKNSGQRVFNSHIRLSRPVDKSVLGASRSANGRPPQARHGITAHGCGSTWEVWTMAKRLDVGALLGAAVSDSNTMQVHDIPLAEIDENEDNRYDQRNIDELAESIQVVGLQQPLVVQANGERYLLIAGHRRRNALALLGRKTAPCIVLAADLDPSRRTLILHWTNTMARGGAGLTGSEVAGAAREIEAALVDLKQRRGGGTARQTAGICRGRAAGE